MGIRQLLLAGGRPQTLLEFSGVLTIGSDEYENPDPPPFITESYVGYGEIYLPFGSLSPDEYGNTLFTSFFTSNVYNAGQLNALTIGRSGTDTTSTMFPTINDYPMLNGGLTGSVDTTALVVNVPQNLLAIKYFGTDVTVRFALRTDIIQAAGTSTLTVPSGATRAVIYALGGGGGGARTASSRFGGGNGAYCVSDIAVASSEWGTSMSYTVGAAGVGRVSTAGNGTAGGATTVTHTGLGVSISAGGGGGGTTTANGTGGTASGGATLNTNGSAGTSATGYNPANEVAFTNSHQGGQGGVGANGTNGRAGLVAVVWY